MDNALKLPITSEFKQYLYDLQLTYIRRFWPALQWIHEELRQWAWERLERYIKREATDEAQRLVEQNSAGHNRKKSNIGEQYLEKLLNNPQIPNTLLKEAKMQVISERALLYACDVVLERCECYLGTKKFRDISFMKEEYNKYKKHIKFMPFPCLDNTSLVILSFWLMESPWYRTFLTLNLNFPECLSKELWPKENGERLSLCDKRCASMVNRIYQSWFRTDTVLSPNGRSTINKRAKHAFENCFVWLKSGAPSKIPVFIDQSLSHTHETKKDIENRPGCYYAALYWLRMYKKKTILV
jgi:hypothetical protein